MSVWFGFSFSDTGWFFGYWMDGSSDTGFGFQDIGYWFSDLGYRFQDTGFLDIWFFGHFVLWTFCSSDIGHFARQGTVALPEQRCNEHPEM
jgi:hypothetical protein